MSNEEIASKLSERMTLMANQAATLAAAFAEVERLRLIGVGIAQQITELEEVGMANSEQLFVLTSEIEASLFFLRQPVDAPAEKVAGVAKMARSKRVTEAADETITPKAETKSLEADMESAKTDVPAGAAEQVKHPCHICEDVFYHKVDLVKHLRIGHGLSMKDSVGPDIHARRDQLTAEKADRDSKCDKWLTCEHAIPCFDPDKAALQGTYCLPVKSEAPPACWNRSCAWGDLAQGDNCDADDQFRRGRTVAECECYQAGSSPVDGADAAACFNTGCPSNDPELPTCCEEWEEVWECPQVVTAGWGPAKDDEPEPPKVKVKKTRAKKAAKEVPKREESKEVRKETAPTNTSTNGIEGCADVQCSFWNKAYIGNCKSPKDHGCGWDETNSILRPVDESPAQASEVVQVGDDEDPNLCPDCRACHRDSKCDGCCKECDTPCSDEQFCRINVFGEEETTDEAQQETDAAADDEPLEQEGRAPINCTHPMTERTTNADGSVTCDVCGFTLRPVVCGNKYCASYTPSNRDACALTKENGKPVTGCNDYRPTNLANVSGGGRDCLPFELMPSIDD